MVKTTGKKLEMQRYFSKGRENIYDSYNWEKSNVDITDDSGALLFTQKGVEFPSHWSHLARKIVSSKYFFGAHGTDERENGAKELISRVTEKFGQWARKGDYFGSKEETQIFVDELASLNLEQKMSFNSPVWFNVGTDKYIKEKSKDQKNAHIISKEKIIKIPKGKDREYPQTSACFIQGVDDTMEDIMQLAVNEAMLFKYGSGTGTDLSTLRSSHESLSGGGVPSGPLAYWSFYDMVAGIVKSGGKTRRAAKMNSLKDKHPDIMDFIRSKTKEEKKARILQDSGMSGPEASESVKYQNTNISVRLSDEFMQAYLNDEEWQTEPVHSKELAKEMPKYPAREIMKALAEGTHFCGDPGVQFDTTINKWHTCKASGPINASNPCSEYMFLDDSSCNLASLNLKSFVNEDGSFDIPSFERAVTITAIAQDLNFNGSSFPTKEIAKNSYEYRPLGQGYANLGSLIMERAIPYDSDEARAIAASITALQTGLVYKTSTEMAEKIGTFKHYDKNKESMLEVIAMHRDALNDIDAEKLPEDFKPVYNNAKKVWDETLIRGEKHGFRNAQATVLAPTGTIGFMMDCDTKGVEPEVGLVQTKLLSDGGILRLINGSVEPALKKLKYGPDQIEDIIHYIGGHTNLTEIPHLKQEDLEGFKKSKIFDKDKFLKQRGYNENQRKEIRSYALGNETMEGAPHIKEEHLPIFDCSLKPKRFKRTISTKGHLEMMAAVQPFLSGAISKTVNMPNETTVEEIEQAYVDAWKLGLKSVAIYRDGSKIYQPLNFEKESKDEKQDKREPFRRKLPITRESLTHKFSIEDHEGYMHLGMYPDGGVGEMFVDMAKEGSTVSGLLDGFATLYSLCCQYGVPHEKIAQKFKNSKFSPNGLVSEGRDDMKTANSITEYISNAADKFNQERLKALESGSRVISNGSVQDYIKEDEEIQEELGGFCPICGTQMQKKGHCKEICPNGCHEDNKGCGSK